MTERPGDQPHAPDAALPPLERLVNLTDHAITVDLQTASPHGEDAPVPGTATFAPDGRPARVLDDQALLGDGSVNTPGGLLRETRLRRRPGPAAGLPPAEPGVRYLVSRITALAVRGRPDLVFPFGERRDAQGRVTGGWAGGGQAWTAWLSVAFLALGVVTFVLAARRWYVGQKVRAGRGTAYVIEEQAIAWRHEEKHWVLELAGGFARVLRVPGPEALGEQWRWQADARGAPQWDRRTDQLVHSFWAVHYNDDQVTRNAVFVWAPWPVAMAFGARATARRRGLVLHVRQRPGSGAVGQRHELRLTDLAHDFLRATTSTGPDPAAQVPRHEELDARLPVTIETLREGGEAAARQPSPDIAAFPPARLLLVRIVREKIGVIPLDLARTPAVTVHAPRCLTDSVLCPGSHLMEVAEWRWVGAGGAAEIPWQDFPGTAEAIATWIAGQAKDHPGHLLLLAARMPQEIAVGLGIQLGQRQSAWPERLYPVHFTAGKLVVPRLDLGRHSVPPERG